jgi:hypothetical protein
MAPSPVRMKAVHEPSASPALDGHVAEGDMQILARHAEADHVGRLHLTGPSPRVFDRLPVGVSRRLRSNPRARSQEYAHQN